MVEQTAGWLAPSPEYARAVLSRLVLGLALVFVAAACTTDAGDQGTTTSSPATTARETTTTTAEAVGEVQVTVDAGRIVVIDSEGQVAVMRPDGSQRVTVTDPDVEAIYTQPIWSPGSDRVAFGLLTEDGFFIQVEDADGGESTSIPVANNPFFMHWSPDGERIGVLHNGSQGLDFQIADVSTAEIEVVDMGLSLIHI